MQSVDPLASKLREEFEVTDRQKIEKFQLKIKKFSILFLFE